ncbi:unnamed protein product [Echinostoma caproni]|uniref:Uncharacterized protein n=1 Tax=Echinostoma caproni TaxID=27848 RepID=A0A3P8D4K0_9TREM|nr:unnamed protein product [Echinostoma caproni]
MNQREVEAQAEKANAQKAAAGERRAEVENGRLRDEVNRLRAELLELNDSKVSNRFQFPYLVRFLKGDCGSQIYAVCISASGTSYVATQDFLFSFLRIFKSIHAI